MDSFLNLNNISFSYPAGIQRGKLQVLEDITLKVKKGEFVSIVGPSGCGKTTLLSYICGLLPYRSDNVFLRGAPLKNPSKNIAMVFQRDSLLPWRNALDNTMYGLEMQRIDIKKRTKIAKSFLRLVDLTGFEKFYPHQLSVGMQQRVNLARALAINPQILLMDEPFIGLDAQLRELMQEELLRIWQKTKKTILFVTHQIGEAIYLADRVVVMSKRPGRIKKILTVPFRRPRKLRIKQSYRFTKFKRQIWKLVMEEVTR